MYSHTVNAILTIFLTLSPVLASSQKVVGTFIFERHGDRLRRPTVYLTPVGSQEVFDQGTFMRHRYFDNSSDYSIDGLDMVYDPSQLNAFAPNSAVLQKSAMGFLQGLYPPLESDKTELVEVQGSEMANGTTEETPLDGFQYVIHDGIGSSSPDRIWIQGANDCPAYTSASNGYFDSDDFLSLNSSTFDFYQGLYSLVEGELTKEELNYGNAYEVFDYFEVNYIHNESFHDKISSKMDTFNQVRYLQNVYSRSTNYNATDSNSTIGGATLLGFIQSQLNLTKSTGAPYISYAAGSYSTFYQLFGRLGLFNVNSTFDSIFTGIVNYASAAMFDLIEVENELYVKFSLRNGTDSSVEAISYPIFGTNSDMISYNDFMTQASKVSIADLKSWCSTCDSWSQNMCAAYSTVYLDAIDGDELPGQSKLTLADAGGIGAGVTIGVFLILGLAIWALISRRRHSKPQSIHSSDSTVEKSSV